jgi:hypothetical protein
MKLAIAFVWTIALLGMLFFYSMERNVEKHDTPLRDVVHTYFPRVHRNWTHIVTLSFLALLGVMIASSNDAVHIGHLVVLRFGLFLIIRVLTIFLTTLPCPDPQNRTNKPPLQKLATLGGNTDNMPSGHAGAVFVTLFTAMQFGLVPAWLAVPMVGVQLLTPTITRSHYTIDPIMSLFVSAVVVQNVSCGT